MICSSLLCVIAYMTRIRRVVRKGEQGYEIGQVFEGFSID